MPYHLEKGATLRLLELYVNKPRPEMRSMLDQLRAAAGSATWLGDAVPDLWQDPRFSFSPAGSGTATRDEIITKWLGFVPDGSGGWVPGAGDTTGYWIAYKGDVSEIMRRAFVWALELSLGLAPGGTGPGRQQPWKVEFFWKCPGPWFETWVVNRPVNKRGSEHRGLISVVFMTPSHDLSNVAESPIAEHAKAMVAGTGHPVPSWQDDYEQLGEPFPDPSVTGRPRVPAEDRRYATWIVTHADHQTTGAVDVTTNTTEFADFAEWGIPTLNIYEGVGDVVIVSPSMAAGGVRQDGTV
jgi:hypothetical protein